MQAQFQQEQVLQTLQDHDLYLKPDKCKFHRTEIDFLEMVIGGGQVKMDPVRGIAKWPTPTLVKELRAFLGGFRNFYKDFIDHYSLIAQPLHDLIKKSRKWE